MNPETTTKITSDSEFLFRRLLDPPPSWAIALPVLFAFGVLGLIVLFRRENRWAGMLVAGAVVGAVSIAYVGLALLFVNVFSWWVILVPMLGVALMYVGLMYVKDAHSINTGWATFLGLLRCTVYAILAFVFLLPGCQTFDTTETHAKVLVLLDVSGSVTNTIDDLPVPGEDPAKLPTRQDKVVKLLTAAGKDQQKPFFERLLEKSPANVFRFGAIADDMHVQKFKEAPTERDLSDGWKQAWTLLDWNDFLKPDKTKIKLPGGLAADEEPKVRAKINDLVDSLTTGTNVGGSALQVIKMEAGSFIQAVIVVSDGQSNQGSSDAIEEFRTRVNNPKRPIHVFTVGVGEFRQPVSIKIDELQAPEVARPDDKFPVRVPVIGSGLNDEEFEATLEGIRIEDREGKPVAGEKKYVFPAKKGKFTGGGENPAGTVDFEIDVQDLKGVRSDKDEAGVLEGTWQFVAKVPRHKNEAFPKIEHESEPTKVLVQKKKLRVLLFAGGPNRDYQFVRTQFYRESLEKRVELTVFLQTGREEGVDQDVEGEKLLNHFPDRLGPDDPRDKGASLNNYDVIIAFDPDWTALDVNQLKMLKDWVGTHAGAIIFIAGPVHTYHLARPGGLDLSSLLTIFPVYLKDSRLHGLGIGHDPSRPYVLNFSPTAKFDFLKLDEKGEKWTAGWDGFFWGEGGKPDLSKDARPLRGIFNYYPVEKTKPTGVTIAEFVGPPGSRIEDGQKQQPYMVLLPYGSGKTLYIGSAETWRLRQYKEAYHQRFWLKVARFMAGGATPQKRYGRILLARTATTGTVPFEAQIKGEDLQPLPRDSKPTVQVKRPADFNKDLDAETPASFELRAKGSQGEWNGTFVGSFKVRTPGEYEFRIPVPGTGESLTARLNVRQPNLELDNVRHNFGALYHLASDATPILGKMNSETRKELERLLQAPVGEEVKEGGRDSMRLFFPLKNADAIPKFLTKLQPNRESTKGRLQDLWDQGFNSGYYTTVFWLMLLIPLAVGLLAAAILFFINRPLAALVALGVTAVLCVAVFLTDQVGGPEWMSFPLDLDLSFVMGAVVSLLAIEWLTRKLLKLA
jgi:hypothetical protein